MARARGNEKPEVMIYKTKENDDGSYEYRAHDNSGRRPDVVICEVHWGDEGEA